MIIDYMHMMEIFGSVTAALITAIGGPIAVDWIKRKIIKPQDEVRKEIAHTERVNVEIEEIINKLSCDRVWITMIHNGGHFLYSNKSMQKFSVVYEVVAPGVAPTSSIFTSTPISLYSKFFVEIVNSRFVGISNYDNPEIPSFGLKQGSEATGCKASYIFGMFDFGTGKLIGCVGIDYLIPHVLTDDEYDYFNSQSLRLSGYLSKSEKN